MTATRPGDVAVVTGAASGIGFALSERFAAVGLRVVMADIDGAGVRDAAARLEMSTGAELLPIEVDVRSPSSVEALAATSFARFGAVHVLCNNAGVVPARQLAWEVELDVWRWVLEVDLWGAIHGVRAFVPTMLERGERGHVVNTASIAGVLPFPSVAPYSVAKYGLVALSEVLLESLRRVGAPIGVSVLCPGDVATPLRATSDRLRPSGSGWGPANDLTQSQGAREPSEVAELVVEAIDADRFWIVPDEEYRPRLRSRMDTLVESPVTSTVTP